MSVELSRSYPDLQELQSNPLSYVKQLGISLKHIPR